jgi:hypothetical protein
MTMRAARGFLVAGGWLASILKRYPETAAFLRQVMTERGCRCRRRWRALRAHKARSNRISDAL